MESPRRTCDWPTERSIPMPEEPEVEIEKVDEAVHEAIEREGGRLVKAIAMTTALLATLAAFAALLAGATVNEIGRAHV